MGTLVITTGGTIGALPYENPQRPPEFISMPPEGVDLVRDALQTSFASFCARCVSLEPRDSKLIDASYRENILNLVLNSPEDFILLTHGTDTLLETADYFYQQFSYPELWHKRMIITGAMTPLSNGKESDGYMNLAYSLDQLDGFSPLSAKTNIVLCDFDQEKIWKPRLYAYRPGLYKKFYDTDGRYNRLQVLEG